MNTGTARLNDITGKTLDLTNNLTVNGDVYFSNTSLGSYLEINKFITTINSTIENVNNTFTSIVGNVNNTFTSVVNNVNNTFTTFMETVDSAYAIIDNDLRQLQSNYFIDVPLLITKDIAYGNTINSIISSIGQADPKSNIGILQRINTITTNAVFYTQLNTNIK